MRVVIGVLLALGPICAWANCNGVSSSAYQNLYQDFSDFLAIDGLRPYAGGYGQVSGGDHTRAMACAQVSAAERQMGEAENACQSARTDGEQLQTALAGLSGEGARRNGANIGFSTTNLSSGYARIRYRSPMVVSPQISTDGGSAEAVARAITTELLNPPEGYDYPVVFAVPSGDTSGGGQEAVVRSEGMQVGKRYFVKRCTTEGGECLFFMHELVPVPEANGRQSYGLLTTLVNFSGNYRVDEASSLTLIRDLDCTNSEESNLVAVYQHDEYTTNDTEIVGNISGPFAGVLANRLADNFGSILQPIRERLGQDDIVGADRRLASVVGGANEN